MQNRLTFSLLFWVERSRIKDGKAPIIARITVNGKRANISLQRKVELTKWKKSKSRVNGSSLEAIRLNKYLDQTQVQIQDAYDQLVKECSHISAQSIKARYLGEDSQEHTLLYLIGYHNEQMEESLSQGTLKNYHTTERYVRLFIEKKLKAKDIYLSKLSYRFLIDFENFLRKHRPTNHQRKMENNTVMKHIQRLRKMVTMAYKMEWIIKDPFVRFKANYVRKEREFLTESELEIIINKNFRIERLELVKDLFVFSCYTGLSYIDVMNLNRDNVTIGIDGNKWISTSRQKTKNSVKIPLLDIPMELITKYAENPGTKFGKLFPKMSNQKLNSYLKEIADLCEINKNLTFHIARHTFATTVTLSNGVPISTVSKLLGHSKIATTQIYARVLEHKVSEDISILKSKLEGSKNVELERSKSNYS